MVDTDIIKQLRNQHGWTQEQLATISGVSARTVQRIEASGECSLESKMALAAAFGVKPHALCGVEEEVQLQDIQSPWLNLFSWALLFGLLFTILWLSGGGQISERLHITGPIMLVCLLTLSVRSIGLTNLIGLLRLSLNQPVASSHVSVRHATLFCQQLIKLTYLSGLFALMFFAWHMSFQWPINSKEFSALLTGSLVSTAFYTVFIAEVVFRTVKFKFDRLLLAQNV